MSVQFAPIYTLPSTAYATVYVWRRSSYNPKEFGHVALEIKTGGLPDAIIFYVSFWPGRTDCKCHKRKETSHFHDIDDDRIVMLGPAHQEYKLFNLNIQKIIDAFLKFYNSGDFKWGILGSGSLRYTYERNCAGLTLYLLEKGGIGAIVSDKRTREQSRMLVATIVSLSIFTGVSLWALSKYLPLMDGWKYLHNLWQNYIISTECGENSIPHIENIRKISDRLKDDVNDKNPAIQESITSISRKINTM